MANFVNVTLDATKQWYYGNNGPSELTIIKKVAEFLQIADYMILMKKARENEKMVNLNLLQYESIKKNI